MEERLDDAIWVLKSHAENPTMRGIPPMGYPAAAYPQGMTEALQVSLLAMDFILKTSACNKNYALYFVIVSSVRTFNSCINKFYNFELFLIKTSS